jgi:hypothetical protein
VVDVEVYELRKKRVWEEDGAGSFGECEMEGSDGGERERRSTSRSSGCGRLEDIIEMSGRM